MFIASLSLISLSLFPSHITPIYGYKGCILSKHGVLHVQMGLFGIGEEKLGAICVGAIVCH